MIQNSAPFSFILFPAFCLNEIYYQICTCFVVLYTMSTNTIHHCCKEVKDVCVKHTCSVRRSTYKVGKFIHPSLISDKEYNICWSLNLRLEHNRELDERKKLIHENTTNLEESKKLRRGIEDVLLCEFKEMNYSKKIHDLSHRERNRHILPIAYQILAAVTDISMFEQKGMEYIKDNQSDISVDIGYILSKVTKIISK